MSEIPFLMLTLISAITLVLPLIAYVFRTAFPASFVMWLGGIIWLLIFLTTDNISMGQLLDKQGYNNSTEEIYQTYTPDNYAIRNSETFEPTLIGILLIMLALTYIMIGVLAERG